MIRPAVASAKQADANPKPQLRPRKLGKESGCLIGGGIDPHYRVFYSPTSTHWSAIRTNSASSLIADRSLQIAPFCVSPKTGFNAIADSTVQQDGLTLPRADRTEASQKTKVAVYASK